MIEDDGTWKMWIGKRSSTKQTFPGMYDNIVRKASFVLDLDLEHSLKAAGGLGHDLTPTECMIKESGEEAQIPKELIDGKIKAVGVQ